MKVYCKDYSNLKCDVKVEGEDEADVLDHLSMHLKGSHGIDASPSSLSVLVKNKAGLPEVVENKPTITVEPGFKPAWKYKHKKWEYKQDKK